MTDRRPESSGLSPSIGRQAGRQGPTVLDRGPFGPDPSTPRRSTIGVHNGEEVVVTVRPSRDLPRITASARAREVLTGAVADQPSVVLILRGELAAPALARLGVLSEAERRRLSLLGRVGGCPVYGDADELAHCPHEVLLIERCPTPWDGQAVLRVRPESYDEFHAREIHEWRTRPSETL